MNGVWACRFIISTSPVRIHTAAHLPLINCLSKGPAANLGRKKRESGGKEHDSYDHRSLVTQRDSRGFANMLQERMRLDDRF